MAFVSGGFRFLTCSYMGGAKGTRTPDPHTASVVRYQLRHSPKKLCPSKLHHCQGAFKAPGQGLKWMGVTKGPCAAVFRCSSTCAIAFAIRCGRPAETGVTDVAQ